MHYRGVGGLFTPTIINLSIIQGLDIKGRDLVAVLKLKQLELLYLCTSIACTEQLIVVAFPATQLASYFLWG